MNSRTNDAPQSATFVASLTDVGRVRSVNEDSCDSFLRPDGTRLLVVADGMGGHRGGAVASREALATIASTFTENSTVDPASLLVRAIERANERVFSLARQDPELAGMGTTVVAFLLDAEGRGAVAHVGDSRAYRLRGGRLEALTSDHSVVAEMLQRGVLTAEEAAFHPRRNEILRSVGVLPDVEVDLAAVDVAPDDWFLLCSDGCAASSPTPRSKKSSSTRARRRLRSRRSSTSRTIAGDPTTSRSRSSRSRRRPKSIRKRRTRAPRPAPQRPQIPLRGQPVAAAKARPRTRAPGPDPSQPP